MLDFDAALAQLLAQAQAVTTTEAVPLAAALGRVLADDVCAAINVPGFDNSAMDGYALHVPDFSNPPEQYLVVQRIAAGEVGTPLAAGEAARIFTGAPIPAGANAVAMQEVCSVDGEQLRVNLTLKDGANIRRVGDDIAAGAVILPRGVVLTPAMIGLAASVGVAALNVFAPLRVALLSTGDELVEPGLPLQAGQIYNSNRYVLINALKALGCVVSDLGIVPDDQEATIAALQYAAQSHDVLITSGGVSVGEEDHVKSAVEYLGKLNLWKIAIKPGKPFAFGKIGACDFIGLPGNPVSALVTFLMLVRPFILARQGASQTSPARLPLIADFDWKKAGDRREFLRARLNATGRVELFAKQGSGVLTSMVWGDGLVDLPIGQTISRGDVVSYIPFNSLGA
ncbi:molybdopterin molybdotransferase MoeA [Chitinibacter bivalviorum]|uniref:Molybdopterin molybdenumtransferase n=2 Tax=Chitinibacter bivalviorum TaxID=2739434 RepID=A0A7H9BNW2_9NEIS|nr:molybdopterin molybdotransferase MoeA [Chitinibacter bivalviorum]